MLHVGEEFEKPWHELVYVVDVEVDTVMGTPKCIR